MRLKGLYILNFVRLIDREARLARYNKYWTDLDELLKTHK